MARARTRLWHRGRGYGIGAANKVMPRARTRLWHRGRDSGLCPERAAVLGCPPRPPSSPPPRETGARTPRAVDTRPRPPAFLANDSKHLQRRASLPPAASDCASGGPAAVPPWAVWRLPTRGPGKPAPPRWACGISGHDWAGAPGARVYPCPPSRSRPSRRDPHRRAPPGRASSPPAPRGRPRAPSHLRGHEQLVSSRRRRPADRAIATRAEV